MQFGGFYPTGNQYSRGNNGRYNTGYSNGRNYETPQRYASKPKKRSGCKVTRGGVGKGISCGWRVTRRYGFVKFLAFFHEKSRVYKNRDGKERHTCCIKAEYENGQTVIIPAIYNPDNKKVTAQRLGMVMNPSAPNGGYIGTYRRK